MTTTGVPQTKVSYLLEMRDRARKSGDRNLERTWNIDLAREGYQETTQAPDLERAVPPPARRGRPPRPRCEHGQIVGRCEACNDDEKELP